MSINECFVKFPVIESERLLLRQIKPQDINDLNEILNDFDLNKYWGYYDPETGQSYPEFEMDNGYVENVLNEFKRKSELRFCIVLKDENKVIGEVILYDFAMGRQAEIGYRVNRNYLSKGIASEAVSMVVSFAFERLGLTRIMLKCFAVNKASRRVAEKAGFTKEGFIRKGLVVRAFIDHYIYGYLAEDYFGRNNKHNHPYVAKPRLKKTKI